MNEFLDALRQVLSVPLLAGAEIGERYLHDWSSEAHGMPLGVARPASTDELAAILKLCHAHAQPVVVQGGLSGLCGGGNPREGELVLSLERLKGVEEIDAQSMTMTVRAGTPLQTVQEAAQAEGFLFPLDLGARGTCNIGGNIATNAGGNQVLRFGMARNLVLGLEVVMADGSIISSMNKMLKNNAGYDLKHLFIGSEGTLGVVTRAVLRLYPTPRSRCSALLAMADFPAVVALLQRVQRDFSSSLSTFEVMWQSYYDFITGHVPGVLSPFDAFYPLYVLVELEGADPERDQAHFEEVLGSAMEAGEVVDAAIAASGKDRESFWKIRDGVAEIGNFIRHVGNFDVSVPISAMEAFLEDTQAALQAALPDLQMLVFGHVADSNLHLICHTGRHQDISHIHECVYAVVGRYRGSVSAEHGIGTQKCKVLHHSRSAEEIALMHTLKAALDPKQILNRGRVLPGAA